MCLLSLFSIVFSSSIDDEVDRLKRGDPFRNGVLPAIVKTVAS